MNHSYKVARPAQLSCFLFTMACGTVDIVVWLHWLIVQLDLGPHIVYCVQICFGMAGVRLELTGYAD